MEVVMKDSNRTVFYYLQKLLQLLPKSERPKRVWDETYRYVLLWGCGNDDSGCVDRDRPKTKCDPIQENTLGILLSCYK